MRNFQKTRKTVHAVEAEVDEAIEEAGAKPELIRPSVMKHVDVVDGKVVVLGSDQRPTGQSVKAFVAELRKDPDLRPLFHQPDPSEMSQKEKMDYIDEHGLDAWTELISNRSR